MPRARIEDRPLAAVLATVLAALGCAHQPCVCPSLPAATAAAPSVVAAPPPPEDPLAGWVTYVIRPGDTLAWIADCRGVPVETLAGVNHVVDSDWIRAGAELRVPSKNLCSGRTHAATTPKAAAPGPTESGRASADLAPAHRLLDQARTAYDAADFGNAARLGEAASLALAQSPEREADPLRARAHVLTAMAAAGLEDRERAVAEFGRALALDPATELDVDDRSPRLVELYEIARAKRSGP